ncbi:MAG: phosphatidylserine decarboxylase [Flavobacteriales bacterium]|nr:phosphatidylserine decarboxylase [Flavobacteriales bacterium]
MAKIKFIERSTGQLIEEDVPGGRVLNFLYGKNPLGKLSLFVMFRRKYFTVLFGKYIDSARSKKGVIKFIEKFNIDMDDYQDEVASFETFNEFFYRKIKPSARPIGQGIVSPADGRVLAFPKISDSRRFFIKGSEFNLNTFLGNPLLADKYTDGSMFIVRLAPVDYHRFHFPVEGVATASTKIKGAYYSVSPMALRKNLEIFCQNKREYCTVKTENHGDVLICDVGATLTAGIHQTYSANSNVKKGDEKGYFSFGGSTLVVLFEKNKMSFSDDLIKNTEEGLETWLQMGETIGE